MMTHGWSDDPRVNINMSFALWNWRDTPIDGLALETMIASLGWFEYAD